MALWRASSLGDRLAAVVVAALCLVYGTTVMTGSWAPKAAVLAVLGAAGIPLLLVRASGRGRHPDTRSTWAARLAVLFIAVGALSAARTAAPWLAWVGTFEQGTGWLFMVALGGAWAIGTSLTRPGRRLMSRALVLAAVLNAVAALAQVVAGGLPGIGLGLYQGNLANGLQGNPVFLGGLLVAALVLLADDLVQGRPKQGLWVVMVAGGIGLSGVRMPLLVLVLLLGALLVHARHTAAGALRRSVVFAGQALGGAVAGALLLYVRTHGSQRLVTSTAQGTFGDRIDAWRVGLHALARHPWLGFGPGQFRVATAGRFPLSFMREGPTSLFIDAHDLFVEYAVAVGVVGLVLLVGWMALSVRKAGGPWLAFAGALLATALIEPLNVVVTPLLFLALGICTGTTLDMRTAIEEPSTSRLRRGVLATATSLGAALGVAAGAVLVAGDVYLNSSITHQQVADHQAAEADADDALHLLRPWPDPATELSDIALLAPGHAGAGGIHFSFATPASGGSPQLESPPVTAKAGGNPYDTVPLDTAVSWLHVALSRDPTDFGLWAGVASLQLRRHDYPAARQAALRALSYDRWWPVALQAMVSVSQAQGDRTAAQHWLHLLRQVEPGARLPGTHPGGTTGPPLLGLR